jgi:hypothetical protein
VEPLLGVVAGSRAYGSREVSTGSSIIRIASRRFDFASCNVRPWVSAPGTSFDQATHQRSRFKKVAWVDLTVFMTWSIF